MQGFGRRLHRNNPEICQALGKGSSSGKNAQLQGANPLSRQKGSQANEKIR
jgi:hypothetical protein